MAFDLSKARQEVAQTGADLTKPNEGGGGGNRLPDIGPTRLRLTGYVETGIHETKFQGNPKIKPRAELTFELSGPKHEPFKMDDGTLIPYRVTVKEVVGTHVKNGYIKLFNLLNVKGKAKNFLDLLQDEAWLGTVSHYKFKGNDGKDVAIPQLKEHGAYNIRPTEFQDPENGEMRRVSVAPAVGPLRVFLWDYADLDQWDSLLDFQKDKIRKAQNFVGSVIYNLLVEAGREAELELSERGKKEQPEEEPDGDEAPAREEPAPAAASLTEPAASKAPAKAPASPAKAAKPAAKGAGAAKGADPLQGL